MKNFKVLCNKILSDEELGKVRGRLIKFKMLDSVSDPSSLISGLKSYGVDLSNVKRIVGVKIVNKNPVIGLQRCEGNSITERSAFLGCEALHYADAVLMISGNRLIYVTSRDILDESMNFMVTKGGEITHDFFLRRYGKDRYKIKISGASIMESVINP